MTKVWAGLLLAAGLVLTGCGPKPASSNLVPGPTARADQKALVHKATLTLDYCVPKGTVAQATALATITQPKVIDAFLHHSSRQRIEHCWEAHGVRHGVSSCVLSQLTQAPGSLVSQSARHALGQAIFTVCLVGSQ